MTSPTGTLAAWRRRFLAPAASFPSCARDAPDRLVYSSNEPEAGHASLRVEVSVRQEEPMLDFCARHLGTAPPD